MECIGPRTSRICGGVSSEPASGRRSVSPGTPSSLSPAASPSRDEKLTAAHWESRFTALREECRSLDSRLGALESASKLASELLRSQQQQLEGQELAKEPLTARTLALEQELRQLQTWSTWRGEAETRFEWLTKQQEKGNVALRTMQQTLEALEQQGVEDRAARAQEEPAGEPTNEEPTGDLDGMDEEGTDLGGESNTVRMMLDSDEIVEPEPQSPNRRKRQPSEASSGQVVRKRTTVRNFSLESDAHTAYHFQSSTWDLACFAFSPALLKGTSAMAILLVLVTIFMQVAFNIVCYRMLAVSQFNDELLDDLRVFRTDIAHDSRYQSPLSGMSLAQRLCEKRNDLEVAGPQVEILRAIEDYQGQPGSSIFDDFFGGQLLCVLALVSWTMTVNGDLRRTLDFFSTLLRVERGPTEVECTIQKGVEMVRLTKLSRARFLSAAALCWLRFIMACGLMVSGSQWLAHEPDVGNLLTNSVALQFIMQIDFVVFAAAAPDSAKRLVAKLKPIQRKSHMEWHGLGWKGAASLALLTLNVVYTVRSVVIDLSNKMTEAERILCEDRLDFVYGTDNIQLVYVTGTDGWLGEGDLRDLDTPQRRAVLQAMQASHFTNLSRSIHPSEVQLTLRELINLPVSDTVDTLNPTCTDIIPSSIFDFTYFMHYYVGFTPVENTTCPDIAFTCSWEAEVGLFTRMLCAKSCYCDSPGSPTPSHLPAHGCPSACTQTTFYQDLMVNIPCEDWTFEALGNSSFWPVWTAYFRNLGAWRPQMPNAASRGAIVADLMERQGCGALDTLEDALSAQLGQPTQLSTVEICAGTSITEFRPWAPVCPQTCGCRAEQRQDALVGLCPGKCNAPAGQQRPP